MWNDLASDCDRHALEEYCFVRYDESANVHHLVVPDCCCLGTAFAVDHLCWNHAHCLCYTLVKHTGRHLLHLLHRIHESSSFRTQGFLFALTVVGLFPTHSIASAGTISSSTELSLLITVAVVAIVAHLSLSQTMDLVVMRLIFTWLARLLILKDRLFFLLLLDAWMIIIVFRNRVCRP